jgi:hypothetical protein
MVIKQSKPNIKIGCYKNEVHTANALSQKFESNIPRNQTAWPRSQFLHSFRAIYCIYPTISAQTQYSKIAGPIVGIHKSLTDTGCRNLEKRGRSVSFLGIFVSNFLVQCVMNEAMFFCFLMIRIWIETNHKFLHNTKTVCLNIEQCWNF